MDSHSTDYRNDKHRKQCAATLETYAYPLIGHMLVADIAMRDVLGVMTQPATGKNAGQTTLWTAKSTTAERTLGRIKTVLDYATVNEYRSGNMELELELPQFTGHFDLLEQGHRLQ